MLYLKLIHFSTLDTNKLALFDFCQGLGACTVILKFCQEVKKSASIPDKRICKEEGRLVQTKSGKHFLQDSDNFQYYHDKQAKNGRTVWKCKFYNKQMCKARVKTIMSDYTNIPIIVEKIGYHTHSVDDYPEIKQAKSSIKTFYFLSLQTSSVLIVCVCVL